MSKVLVASFSNDLYFKIPKALARIINNKNYVEDYYVIWSTLYINLTNGEQIKIESSCESGDNKRPNSIQIENSEDYPYLFDQD